MKRVYIGGTGAMRSRLFQLRTTRGVQSLFVLLALLLVLRASLPFGVQWYVNQRLGVSPVYEGSVGDVDLYLYRGAYSLEGVTIHKLDGEVPVPLFAAERVEFSLLWSALIQGSVVASIVFEDPDIHIVDSAREEGRQTGVEGRWLNLLEDLVPTRIDEVRIDGGSVHFHNFEVEQTVNVYISALEVLATNLTNSQQLAESLVGRIEGHGDVVGAGNVEFSASFDPDSQFPTFDLAGRMRGVPLVALDDLVDAYAPFDIEAGMLSLTTELRANDGEVTGYVKPLITELEIFDWHSDVVVDQESPFRIIWEGTVDVVAELLENQKEDQLATLIEVEGRFDDPETSNWTAFVNILRNAFIEAFDLDYEGLAYAKGGIHSESQT